MFELKCIFELFIKIDSYIGRSLIRWAIEFILLIFIWFSELCFVRWLEIDFEVSIWIILLEWEFIFGVKYFYRGLKMCIMYLVFFLM